MQQLNAAIQGIHTDSASTPGLRLNDGLSGLAQSNNHNFIVFGQTAGTALVRQPGPSRVTNKGRN